MKKVTVLGKILNLYNRTSVLVASRTDWISRLPNVQDVQSYYVLQCSFIFISVSELL